MTDPEQPANLRQMLIGLAIMATPLGLAILTGLLLERDEKRERGRGR